MTDGARSEPGLRRALPSLLLLAFLLPDLWLAEPGWVRLGWVVLVTVATAWLLSREDLERALQPLASPRRFHAFVAAWIVAGITLSLVRYAAFGDVLAYDTAYHVQVLWNTLHGRTLEGSLLQSLHFDPPLRNHFGLHVSPTFVALLPVFAVAPGYGVLLVVKVVASGLAALPLYALARRSLGEAAAFLVGAAYLLHPTVLAQTTHAFYPVVLVAPLLMGALWAWEVRRPVLFALLCAGALGVREDVGLVLAAFFGVGLLEHLVSPERRRPVAWWLLPPLVGLAWYVVCVRFVMPAVGGSSSSQSVLSWYAGFGESPGAIIARIVTDPLYTLGVIFTGAKVLYVWQLLRPWALLSVLGIPSLVALPSLAVNLLVTRPNPGTIHPTEHYSVTIAVALAAGAVAALVVVRRRYGDRAALVAAVLATACSMSSVTDVFSKSELARLSPPAHASALREALARVEKGTTVSAPGYIVAHVATSPQVWASDRIGHYPEFRPQWALFDRDTTRFYLQERAEPKYRARLARFEQDPGYEIVLDRDDIVLFRRRGAADR